MPDTAKPAIPTWQQKSAEILANRIARVAADLRVLADRCESYARQTTSTDQPPASFANIASGVQHQLLWGVANLAMDSLVQAAYDADAARADATRTPTT